MEPLTTRVLILEFGFSHEPHNLFECFWHGSGLRIRQVLATQYGEAAVPLDVFETLDRIPIRTVQELEQLLPSNANA